MLYAIYGPDGRIIQSNKVWHAADADSKYDYGLHDLGQKFVKRESEYVLSPDDYFVDVKVEELIDRPSMPVEISKLHIKAGTDDRVLLTGIPTAAKYSIMAGSIEYQSGNLDENGTEIELSVPVPCSCTIILDKWPYRTFTAKVEVHA